MSTQLGAFMTIGQELTDEQQDLAVGGQRTVIEIELPNGDVIIIETCT